MSPATTTTITGVSILAKKRHRRADVFDITLSHEGIDIKRPGRNEQHLSWDRISQWEIAEHTGFLVLTLRGDGAVTPLVVKGWTLEDLEVVMRDVTSRVEGPVPTRTQAPVPAPAPVPPPTAATPPPPRAPAKAAAPAPAARSRSDESRAARRRRIQRRRRTRWKPIVTVVLIAALATAVVLVLLQSAGVISWSFLGPTA